MPSLSDITLPEFSIGLTPERLRPGMLIQVALGLGSMMFFVAVLTSGLSHRSGDAYLELPDFLRMLTIIDVVMFVLLTSAGTLVYRARFTPRQLESAFAADLRDRQGQPISATPVEKAISFIRTTMLIRTAIFEGSAFFGLTVLMIAAIQGLLFLVPWLWINAIPLAVFEILIATSFPTKNKMLQIFEEKIQKAHS